jgi:2-oxoacid:acceptor oxidoreductase gamma subunit (pyruvate/2-ketoisovalerate family)
MKEIRIHGRGGQGVVLASEIFVNAAVKEGKHAACFPYFGFERRGAPVFGFVRFDTQPIRQKDQVYHPDCLVVFDHTLFKAVDIYQGIKQNGILILNAAQATPEIPLPPQIEVLGLVDATRISVETVGAFIPNTAMLGALARVTGWVRLDSLVKSVREMLPRRIQKKNIEILERAYAEAVVQQRDWSEARP